MGIDYGILPEINKALEEGGSTLRYRNLLGLTLGTGFGGGIVVNGEMLEGDNSAAAEIWALRSKLHRDSPVEEDVSIRALRRVYAEIARMPVEEAPDPAVIAEIARHSRRASAGAREAYRRFGEALGDAIANAITLIDGPVVLGGGLSANADLFMPAVMNELNTQFQPREGARSPRTVLRAFNLEDETERRSLLAHKTRDVVIPRSERTVTYDPMKRIGIGVSKLGASKAAAIGAYQVAVTELASRETKS
jgi:glucokinase